LDRAGRWLDTHDGGLPSGEEDALGRHLHNGLEAHLLRLQAEAWPKASSPRREATRPGTRCIVDPENWTTD
jgi:hypothetical protein